MSDLPLCANCPNSVKPGDDYCFTCLGEEQTEDIDDRTFYSDDRTFYSKVLLKRLVPALVNANHVLANAP